MSDNVNLNIEGDEEELSLNFEGVKDMDFTPIPDGKYLLKVISVDTGKTRADDVMLKFQFALADVDDNDPLASKKIFYMLPVVPPKNGKPGSLWKVRQVLEAITGLEIAQGAINFKTSDLMGRRFYGTLGTHTYQQKKDKTDPNNTEMVTRTGNEVLEFEKDFDSLPPEAITVTGNMSY